jgi:transposase
MVYGAIDLHARHSVIRVIDAAGHVLGDRRVPTDRMSFEHAFAPYVDQPCRILLEAGTESAWVAQGLEAAGHEVVIADPNFAPMYGDLRRKVKTDMRDVAALAEANRRGWYRPAYRVSAAQRARRQQLRVRRQVVQMRTGTISVVRALLRQSGYRASKSSSEAFGRRVATLALPPALRATIAPLLRVLTQLTAEIVALDGALAGVRRTDPVVAHLQTVPGIGPVAAVTFRAFVDDVTRFPSAAQVSAAIGLVPSEDSSAERRHRGHITKAGPSELRSVLVQAAWVYWRTTKHGPLRRWVDALAARRGKRIAVVALARRLSRILFAIWRDGTTFHESRLMA